MANEKGNVFEKAVAEVFGCTRLYDYYEHPPAGSVRFKIDAGGFKFDELMALTQVLGTTHIEWYTHDAGGCDTCGPDYETTFDARGVKFP